MGNRRQSPLVSWLRRTMAAASALLILVLGLLAVSPHFHERLHHHGNPGIDGGCAVVLFANGVAVPVDVIALPPATIALRESPTPSPLEILPESPRYLLQPGRGPPALG